MAAKAKKAKRVTSKKLTGIKNTKKTLKEINKVYIYLWVQY